MHSLEDAFLLMVAAVLMVPLFKRLGLGSVLGYLSGGIVLGPAVLGLITDVEEILHFSELGVVLLLFAIGLELQPSRLWSLRKPVFGMGGLQVGITGALLAGIALALGLSWQAALVAGFGLALSSTAFCLQILSERGHLRTSYGRNAFSILLFQDVAVVPLLAIVPILAPDASQTPSLTQSLIDLGLALGTIGAVIVVGRLMVGRFLDLVVGTRIQELFTTAALAVVVGVALMMEHTGMSMALGAFLAGMLLADSPYRHELKATIDPFKGLLLGLFFMAVGMSVNLGLVTSHLAEIAGLVVGLMVLKAGVLFALARVFGASVRSALSLAALMPQGGEFAFVLFAVAVALGVIDTATGELLLVVVTLSMALTPVLVRVNAMVQDRTSRRGLPGGSPPEYDTIDEGENRVIIAGFGRVGQIVARTLRMAGIPFTALESDFEQIGFLRRRGNRVYYGDPARPDLLHAAGIEHAEVFVIAVDDAEKALTIAEYIRARYPHVRILARARNRKHAYLLMEKGAHRVFREVYGSSLEIAEQVFRALGHPDDAAARSVALFRRHDEALMDEQFTLRYDEDALLATATAATIELRDLFEQDAQDEAAKAEAPPPLPPPLEQGEAGVMAADAGASAGDAAGEAADPGSPPPTPPDPKRSVSA